MTAPHHRSADTERHGSDKSEPDSAPNSSIAAQGMAQDAARYRWLRAEHERVDPVAHVCWKADMRRESSEWVNTSSPDNLDVQIDTALRPVPTGERE